MMMKCADITRDDDVKMLGWQVINPLEYSIMADNMYASEIVRF